MTIRFCDLLLFCQFPIPLRLSHSAYRILWLIRLCDYGLFGPCPMVVTKSDNACTCKCLIFYRALFRTTESINFQVDSVRIPSGLGLDPQVWGPVRSGDSTLRQLRVLARDSLVCWRGLPPVLGRQLRSAGLGRQGGVGVSVAGGSHPAHPTDVQVPAEMFQEN